MADDTAPYSLADLEYYISTCPVVDNHAHNLYRRHGLRTENLLSLTTEAADEALEDTRASLPHLRAAKQLLKLFDLPADADWRAIIEKRFELLDQDADNLIRKCLEKTQTILIDDGFDDAEVIEPYDWHDQFTRSPCKRLIRIDEEASHILSLMHDEGQLPTGIDIADEDACYLAWAAFFTGFSIIIEEGLSSSSVAGFKSAICFSNGLNVSVGSDDGFHSFCKEHLPSCVKDDFAIQAKGMNDALVVQTCKLISAAHEQGKVAKHCSSTPASATKRSQS